MIRRSPIPCAAVIIAGLAVATSPLRAQPVTERSPNLEGAWTASSRTLHFAFSHRFQVVGSDADISDIFGDGKVVAYPTFSLRLGLPGGAEIGTRYSTNSLVSSRANEWQPFLKWAPVATDGSLPLAVAATAAWNSGVESADAEVTADVRAGRLIFIGAVRGFSDLYEGARDRGHGTAGMALAGGIGFRLHRYLTVAADVADVVAGGNAPAAWSAALQVGIPYTPHTLSILATNVSSGTLQGASIGVPGTVYWGFEFTVPFSGFARWGRILRPDSGGSSANAEAARAPEGSVVEVEMRGFEFRPAVLRISPGTTVRWINRDPVGHTTRADHGAWSSRLLGPGDSFEHRFDDTGVYEYGCDPHPFMRGRVVVVAEG